MNKVVTILDIAEKAGVGKGTVDRVLHNRGRVSEETRTKVLNCINELNYKPNKAARMLAKKGAYKIAVTYHNAESEFWDQIQEGITRAEEEYKPLGISIDYYVLPNINSNEQLNIINHVIHDQYDGLALVPYDSTAISKALNDAIQKGLQVVSFNNHDININCSYIGQDGIQSGKTAGKMMAMVAKPNSKYAVFSAHNKTMKQIDERCEGFQYSIKAYRKDMALTGIYNFEECHKIIYNEVQDLLKKKVNDIDAIYVTSAITGTVAKAIEDMHMEKKMTLIGHDLTRSIVHYMKKGIIDISIGQEPEKQGYLAIDRICKKLLTDEQIEDDYYTGISIVVSENVDFS